MLDAERQMKIDRFINGMPNYYQENSFGRPVPSLNLEERKYLNENACLHKLLKCDRKFVLSDLLRDKTKTCFTTYLFLNTDIDLEVNKLARDGKSIFQILFFEIDEPIYLDLYKKIQLYKRGYKKTQRDEEFLNEFYKNRITNPEINYRWLDAKLCYLLSDYGKICKALQNRNVIFTIASFKKGRPVGYNFRNLLQVANNALQHDRNFCDAILKAAKHYNVYDIILNSDKKGTFQLKEKEFLSFKPVQDIDFNSILIEIFPELKDSLKQAGISGDFLFPM